MKKNYNPDRKYRMKDVRNNWVTFQWLPKCRFRCFRKQSVIDTCTAAFREFERLGFEFGEFGFAVNHVHFRVNVPKRYSIEDAEIMLKSRAAKRIFEEHPGFRKRYPRGSFWAGYEHHESVGRKSIDEADAYLRGQLEHHNERVIDDTQKDLAGFAAERGYVNARAQRA